MTKDTKKTPTTRELIAARQQAAAPKQPVTTPKPAVIARADNREYRQRYLDEVAPGVHRRPHGQVQQGRKVRHPPTTMRRSRRTTSSSRSAARRLVGWIRFNGEGEPPDR